MKTFHFYDSIGTKISLNSEKTGSSQTTSTKANPQVLKDQEKQVIDCKIRTCLMGCCCYLKACYRSFNYSFNIYGANKLK